MCESLDDINENLLKYNSKLYFYKGDTIHILEKIINSVKKESEIKDKFKESEYLITARDIITDKIFELYRFNNNSNMTCWF